MVTPRDLANEMLRLAGLGCANIEAVSPSHHLPALLEGLALAIDEGLRLPLVYNTNGYESLEILNLLDGVVDVYLPDLKYAHNEVARVYSDVADYVEVARAAILAMHSQVGNLVVDISGAAVKGLILRHLVLPNDLSGTSATLQWAARHLPVTCTLSLMAQYKPMHRGNEFPSLSRQLTPAEYDQAVDKAWELGFENAFVQDLASTEIGLPDFARDDPFDWD